MLFKKLTVLLLIVGLAFAFVAGACGDDPLGGSIPDLTPEDDDTDKGDLTKALSDPVEDPNVPLVNYISGPDALSTGIEFTPLTLGLMPGDTTTEINLNWYSAGTPAGKVAQVRFVRGTFASGRGLIEETGAVDTAAGNTSHKVTVQGLWTGASYQYMVSSNGEDWSPAYDLKVPSIVGAFRFAVASDPQLTTGSIDVNSRYPAVGTTTAAGWLETMTKIVAKNVSFIAFCGDQVDASNGNETEYTNFFAPPGLRNLPFSPVSGNHDNHLHFNYHYNLPNVQTFETETVATAAGRNYFYLYNNILFVVLNTAPYAPGTNTNQNNVFSVADATPHITRFRSTIQEAKTKFAGKYEWLIVQHHKSTASVADHLADRDIQGYVEAGFEKLMSDENVDLVIAGHDHVYARSYPLRGRDNGYVSVPIKTGFPAASGSTWTNPGNPIYFTFTTGSGLKYYAVAPDPTFNYTSSLYVQNNTAYPYLDAIDASMGAGQEKSTKVGSSDYLTKNYLPVSNAAFVQPYIPSYTIVDVNGKSITFKTYAITTKTGTNPGVTTPYSFDENTPYDEITITKN